MLKDQNFSIKMMHSEKTVPVSSRTAWIQKSRCHSERKMITWNCIIKSSFGQVGGSHLLSTPVPIHILEPTLLPYNNQTSNSLWTHEWQGWFIDGICGSVLVSCYLQPFLWLSSTCSLPLFSCTRCVSLTSQKQPCGCHWWSMSNKMQ